MATEDRALLIRRVHYGDADLIVHCLTETRGRVSALARAARRSRKRFGGALEPFQTLRLLLEERRSELWILKEARIETPRVRLLSTLVQLETAGRFMGWLAKTLPHGQPEPGIFELSEWLLDSLDQEPPEKATRLLAAAGLELSTQLGWALDLERCVACGKACADGRAALLDPRRGGLVCRSCGGGRLRLGGQERSELARFLRASSEGGDARSAALPALPAASSALDLVASLLSAHADID